MTSRSWPGCKMLKQHETPPPVSTSLSRRQRSQRSQPVISRTSRVQQAPEKILRTRNWVQRVKTLGESLKGTFKNLLRKVTTS
ncbi:uncharacterized protein N7458_009643 [Penicillium daleae]|uniref:Uncharacterized protein n=1 Tax=Penicillium daleae TaxID=63821 RepID=A0AAD6BYB1_9EURO|nr:uncharacterized protein N7458_009643 [Penicillium daleae]KAJ5438645.1 hypothetical protein N7458_009643 [Penicillium daleae]